MPLKTLVKVGSITNLSDARYCAGMGVDFLGFRVVEGQTAMIPVKSFQEIRGWITGPQIVAEIYGVENEMQLSQILRDTQPDYLELSLEEYRKVGAALTLPYILNLRFDDELPQTFSTRPAYIITDVKITSNTSKLIPEYDLLVNVVSLEDLQTAISQTGISGISLHGGNEIRPGLKDYEALSTILEALEED